MFVCVTYKGTYETTEVMKSGRHGSAFEATMYWVRNADVLGHGTDKTRKGADEVPSRAAWAWAEELERCGLGGDFAGAPYSAGDQGRGSPVPFGGEQMGQTGPVWPRDEPGTGH